MKQKSIFTALAVVLVLGSCAKQDNTVAPLCETACFNATLENSGPETRTTIQSDYSVEWVKDDLISINGKQYRAESGGASTVLKAVDQPASGTEYNAYYPSSLVGSDGKTTTLPSVQKFGGYGVISNVPTYAYSTDNTLSFQSLCGVLAVTVDASDVQTLKAIKVSADQPLCGEFELAETSAGSGIKYAKLKDSAKDTVVTLLSENVLTIDKAHTFYITLPVGTYTNISVALSSDGSIYNHTMSTKSNKEIGILRNTVYTFDYKVNAIRFRPDVIVLVQL